MTKQSDDDMLEALFSEAGQDAPVPSSDLLARIAEDAAHQIAPAPRRPRSALWTGFEAIGGWFGVGGLVSATLVGLYIGNAAPGLVTLPELGIASEDGDIAGFLPGDDLFFEEG